MFATADDAPRLVPKWLPSQRTQPHGCQCPLRVKINTMSAVQNAHRHMYICHTHENIHGVHMFHACRSGCRKQ